MARNANSLDCVVSREHWFSFSKSPPFIFQLTKAKSLAVLRKIANLKFISPKPSGQIRRGKAALCVKWNLLRGFNSRQRYVELSEIRWHAKTITINRKDLSVTSHLHWFLGKLRFSNTEIFFNLFQSQQIPKPRTIWLIGLQSSCRETSEESNYFTRSRLNFLQLSEIR